MKTLRQTTLWALLLGLVLTMAAAAQELSVRNKPYKGETQGRGVDMLVRLDEMAKALDLPAVKAEAGWTLDGAAVPTVDQAGVPYVKLSELKAAGVKVTLNKDFNIIDVTRPVAKSNTPGDPAWSAGTTGLTMVHFGAPW